MTKECTIQPQLEGLGYQALAVEAGVLNRLLGSFIFTHVRQHNEAKKNGFIGTDNYRGRALKKPAEMLGLAKLNIQVLRRTMATLGQTKGGVKDGQGVLGHSKADTTGSVSMHANRLRLQQETLFVSTVEGGA